MKKIVFLDGKEISISGIVHVGDTLDITIHSSDIETVLDLFRDNPASTKVMRYYVGTDLLCGYKDFTHLSSMTFTPDVTESVDYTTEDHRTKSGFVEHYTDVINVRMEKTENTAGSINEQNALAADVKSLKEDMAAINAVLEGGKSDD